MNTNDNKHCCICLESFDKYDFICQSCNEGVICDDCTYELGDDIEEIEKCPICRTLNYRHHYKCVINNLLYSQILPDIGLCYLQDENSKALSVARRNNIGEEEYDYLKVEIYESGRINIFNIDYSIEINIESEEMYERYLPELFELAKRIKDRKKSNEYVNVSDEE